MKSFVAIVIAGLMLAAAPAAFGQAKPIVKTETVTKTVTIEAIERSHRMITFKDDQGVMDTVQAGPAITRFDELKVGDKVTFRYYESIVYQLKKEGASGADKGEVALSHGTGQAPGGTLAQQITVTVTVVSVDPNVPSITVKTQSGDVVTRKIEDKKNLEGVAPGDRIVITYTQALLAAVESPK
jgi:hypothetical protein